MAPRQPDETAPLMAREGSRSSSLDEEEAAAIPPPARTEPDVDSNLMRRAGRILAFGVVATVIILLGLVGQFGGAAVARVELGTPHDGMAVGNVVHLPDGNLAHRPVRSSALGHVDALSPEERAAAARRDAARARRQSSREARRRRRQWDRDTEEAEAKTLALDDQPLASLGQAQETGGVAGVSLNGWLQLEEWFYSQDAHSLVDATEGMTQGVVFPPVFPTPESLGFEWASEGDLISKLAASVGDDAAVAAVVAHRESYFTAEDVAGLRKQGFDHVRLPLTWAAFASEADEPEKLVTDPAHPDKKQVTVSRAALDRYVATLADAGLKVLIDMHTMPGGSSMGSYNGVFPSPPAFWDDPTLMTIGRGVVREMLRWYLALPETSRAAVGGFTLLNEPAHLLPDKRDVMLDWLAGAVADFRALVVEPAKQAGAQPPRLLVNLIDTCGLNVYNMAEWMARTFAADELQSWAVLDTHMYLAWEHPAPGTWSCETDPEETKNGIAQFMQAKVNEMNDAAARNGIAHTAVSEWSLATNHDSAAGCQDVRVLEALREAQQYAFDQGNVESYFWGWKLPDAGAHRKFWSAQFHDAEMAAAAGAAAAGEAEADAVAAAEEVPAEAAASAAEEEFPAEAELTAAVEGANDAGVSLESEAVALEPDAKEAAPEIVEDASGDVRAEAAAAEDAPESGVAAAAASAEEESANVEPARPAEAVAVEVDAASGDAGAQTPGEGDATIDAAREFEQVDAETTARRNEIEARMRAGATNFRRSAAPEAVVAPETVAREAVVPPEVVVQEVVVPETVVPETVVPEPVSEQPAYERPVVADEDPVSELEDAAARGAVEPVVEPVEPVAWETADSIPVSNSRNQVTRVL
jgi:hypothetical protein